MNHQLGLYLSVALAVGAALVVFFGTTAFITNMKLFSYLKKNLPERWNHLTTIGAMGPGMSNPFRWFPYLYNDEDTADPTVFRLKRRVRSLLVACACVPAALLVLGVIGFIAIRQ